MAAEPERALSPIVPVLIAVLVCDVAVVDPNGNKKSLIGIFDRIYTRAVPTGRSLSVYVKLSDAEGFYRFLLRLVHLNSGKTVAEAHGEIQANDRLLSVDGMIPATMFPFPDFGRYEFQVHTNDVYLGSATLDVVPAPEDSAGGA